MQERKSWVILVVIGVITGILFLGSTFLSNTAILQNFPATSTISSDQVIDAVNNIHLVNTL